MQAGGPPFSAAVPGFANPHPHPEPDPTPISEYHLYCRSDRDTDLVPTLILTELDPELTLTSTLIVYHATGCALKWTFD